MYSNNAGKAKIKHVIEVLEKAVEMMGLWQEYEKAPDVVENAIEMLKVLDKPVTGETSDGYHTFDELYQHRANLYMAVCRLCWLTEEVWLSKMHSDGSVMEGWFILGIGMEKGKQITYHMPDSLMDECGEFAYEVPRAPEYDGHTSQDVLVRINALTQQL